MGTVPNIIKSAGNQFVTTLSSGINDSTTSIQLTSATGLNTKGVLIIDEGNSNEEIVYYESYTGTTLTIASDGRGYAGTTAASHSAGATVTDVLVQSHVNGLADKFLVEHTDTGTHGTITGATLTTPVITSFYQDAGLTKLMTVPNVASDTLVTLAATQTLTAKTLTSPVVTTPTLTLADTTPATDGVIGFNRTTEDLVVGDGTNSRKIRMGAFESFAPTMTGYSSAPSMSVYYTVIGTYCYITGLQTALQTSNATSVTMTLPFTAKTRASHVWMGTIYQTTDNSAAVTVAGRVQILSAGTTASFFKDVIGTGWTASNNKSVGFFSIAYEIA